LIFNCLIYSFIPTSGKYYQIFQSLLAYLSQPAVLGRTTVDDINVYRSFSMYMDPEGRQTLGPYGRETLQWYMQNPLPSFFAAVPVTRDASTPSEVSFFDTLVNWRVALVVACLNPWDKPTDPLYLLPEAGQEPLFDCSAFPTHFSHLGTSSIASVPLGYGGAAVERFVTPTDLRLSHTSPGAVRMKVVAVPVEGITTVTEVVKGSSVLLTGLYENVYVVLVNVDPLGEVITEEEQAVWKRSTYSCQPGQGSCWTFARPGMNYSDNMITGLVTPPISLPLTSPATLSLDIKFVLQGSADPTRWVKGCAADRLVGYDGVQLRARVGDATHVLLPTADSNFPYSMVTDPTSGTVFRGSVLSFFGYYLHYAGLCDYLVGWIGDSLGWKTDIAFDLSLFQGQTVELEVFLIHPCRRTIKLAFKHMHLHFLLIQ
jgi:hypothetical protein